jgi:hypothetical protein
MDAHAALTFNLVEQYMQNLLAQVDPEPHEPLVRGCTGRGQFAGVHVTKWRDKLRVVPHTFNKVPAPIDPEAFRPPSTTAC